MDKRFMDSPHLDLIRNGRLLRAKDFGLTPTMNTSLEINQSFPRLSRKLKSASKVQLSKQLLNLENAQTAASSGMDSISFSTQATNTSLYRTELTSHFEDSILGEEESATLNPNPHKGVLTIDIISSQILITNTIACKMLGYSSDELLSIKFRDLIAKEKFVLALPDMMFNEKGEIVVFNGKVIELQCKDGSKIAVSCWLTKAESENENCSLYIAVIEPVQRVVAHLLLDESGTILEADEMSLSLFQSTEDAFIGHKIQNWVPNILWPSSTDDLDLDKRIQRTIGSSDSKQCFPLTMRLDPSEGDSDTTTTPCYEATIWVFTNLSGMLLINEDGIIIDCNPMFAQLALGYVRSDLIGKELSEILLNFQVATTGHFTSELHHENGSFIPVTYFINGPIEGLGIYQIWMAIATPSAPTSKSMLGVSELLSRSRSLAVDKANESQVASKESSVSNEDMAAGEYSQHYQFVKQIGSGGFGCVHLATRQSDNKLVVSKFIKKSKVYHDSWIDSKTDGGRRLPFEIHFLSQIQHENIVSMTDFYENDTYFQMVMEKHGFGMDLFEFIEKTNGVCEPLGAYIARQLVDAVHYLHSRGIVHRDIKDENVVLDDHFHAKLIDFGSAAFLTDKPFKAFCGTFEYCSPEVLKGQPYLGPELEVWAMGTTIYILIFGRNPYSGIEEILKNELEIPKDASAELRDLLEGMMNRNTLERWSVQESLNCCWINQVVDIDDYDFYEVCDLNRSSVEFVHSRLFIDDEEAPVHMKKKKPLSLATSTPYKGVVKPKNLDQTSFNEEDDVNDSSVHFQVPELVFNEISNHSD